MVFGTPNGALLHRRVFKNYANMWHDHALNPEASPNQDRMVVFEDNRHAKVVDLADLSIQRTITLTGMPPLLYSCLCNALGAPRWLLDCFQGCVISDQTFLLPADLL